MIPLKAIVTIIKTNTRLIGLEDAGTAICTMVRNIANDSNTVIDSPTRSPDSTGSRNRSGFNNPNKMVGQPTTMV